MRQFLIRLFLFLMPFSACFAKVELGVDLFFKGKEYLRLKDKKVALLTNQTGRDSEMRSTSDLFFSHAKEYIPAALFVPEHGLNGAAYAWERIENATTKEGVPIFSLHGDTRRPTGAMLKGIDVILYDIQDIGIRSYTYASTLFYVMEEAAKKISK